MKFRNCFIDDQGRVYKESSLWEAVKDLPITTFNLSADILDQSLHWKLNNVRDYVTHFSRVSNTDLSVPIILRSDGVIMDGWHRIIKALFEGNFTLPAQKFTIDPEPAFIP